MNDRQLLEDYVSRNSQEAFAALVQRHLNLVYSVALRCVGDPHKAQDVTQSVFLLLAQKAARLHKHTVLPGWLYQTARLTAATFRRGEPRRQWREQEAFMQSSLEDAARNAPWEALAPVLDDALGRLGELERNAILLRYFEERSVPEVALALGLKEPAARKRLVRALEKLRTLFARRGITVSAGALAAAMAANSVQAAPAGLVATVAAACWTPTLITAAALAATKALTMTTLQKAVVTATVALLAGASIHALRQGAQLREQLQTLEQRQAPLREQIQRLQQERDDATNRLASWAGGKSRDTELLRLRAEVSTLRQAAREQASTESVVQGWATRLASLKQRLDQMPDMQIPEMAFLTDKDWAAAARDANLDTNDGVRQAMRALRSAAKANFLSAMRDAMKKFAVAANGGVSLNDPRQFARAVNANSNLLPSDLAQLKPYFNVPVDDTLLHRYQYQHPEKLHDNQSDILVKESASPADAEYDTCHQMGLYMSGVRNVNLVEDAVTAAAKEYAQANSSQMPSEPAQIAPYLKSPLDAALVQKYFAKLPTAEHAGD